MDNSKNDYALGKAAQFCARLGAADCSAAERESCERWRRADPDNERAYRQVVDVAAHVEQAVKSDPRLQRLLAQAMFPETELEAEESTAVAEAMRPRDRRRSARRLNYRKPLAVAASTLLAALAVWMTVDRSVQPATTLAATQIFSAPEKSPRQITLNDGSVVHIDAGAKLSVAMSSHERRINLIAGRAFFEVAHDAQRPFVVTANDTQTVALGTQFEVQRRDAETTVTLVEGSVAVSGTNTKLPWSERLVPGNQLRVAIDKAELARSEVDTDSVVGWSRGWLVFRGTPLGDALREINRYSIKQVTLAEGSLANMTVAGSFIAGESESIVNAIAEVLPIRVVDGGSREIILFKRYEE